MIESANQFLVRVSKLDKGDRSALKRAVGTALREANAKALSAFYKCLPRDTPKWQEDRWFAIGCIRCLWDEEANHCEPLEKVVHKMIFSEELSKSTENKMKHLLDSAWESDGNLLTNLARLMRMIRQKTSSELNIDLASLLSDLIYWNSSNQYVQRRWAREIFAEFVMEDDED